MKRLLVLMLLSVLTGTTFAQKPSEALNQRRLGAEQPVATDVVRGTLTPTDPIQTNTQGQQRYADSYALTLAKGEQLVIEYASPGYRVMLALKVPDGTFRYALDSLAFEGLSTETYRYTAPVTGTYLLQVTSADPAQAGPYLLRKFIFSPTITDLPAGADFCARVQYLVAQRRLNFERIQGKKLREDRTSGETIYYRARTDVVPGRPAEIFTESDVESLGYKSVLLETTDTAAARRVFEDYAQLLKTCLPDWQHEAEAQEDFFREESAATYTDFLSITMRKISDKAWRVEFNYN